MNVGFFQSVVLMLKYQLLVMLCCKRDYSFEIVNLWKTNVYFCKANIEKPFRIFGDVANLFHCL